VTLRIDNLREVREVWREFEEWAREEEQWHRERSIEWDPWSSRIAPIETDLMDCTTKERVLYYTLGDKIEETHIDYGCRTERRKRACVRKSVRNGVQRVCHQPYDYH